MQTVYIVLILLMTLTSPICESSSISYLALLLPLMFIGKSEYLLSLILFSSCVFYRVPPGIPISPILIILYVLSVIIAERINKRQYYINISLLIGFLLAIGYIFYSCKTSITGSFAPIDKFLAFFLLIYISIYNKSCNVSLLQKLLLITSLIAIPYIVLRLTLFPYIYIDRPTLSSTINANVVVRGLSVMIIMIFISRNIALKGVPNYVKYIVIILGIWGIFITGSRMGIIATIFAMVVVLYLNSEKKNKKIKNTFGLIVVALAGMFVLSSFDVNLGRLEAGLSKEAIENDPRMFSAIILWNEAISKNFFTGIGLGSENSETILTYVPDADNFFVDLLTQMGVIGLSIVVILLVSSTRKLFKYRKKYNLRFDAIALPISVIVLFVPFMFSETVFDEIFIWFFIAITNIYANSIKSKKYVGVNSCS